MTSMIKGYAGRVLEVDLASRTFTFKPLDEDIARLYIGGKGDGARLLYDMTEPGIAGVLINHRDGMSTSLADGDTVTFLKAAAGG